MLLLHSVEIALILSHFFDKKLVKATALQNNLFAKEMISRNILFFFRERASRLCLDCAQCGKTRSSLSLTDFVKSVISFTKVLREFLQFSHCAMEITEFFAIIP